MDTTTVGITLGIALSGAYALLRAIARQSFELNHTVLVFLAAFSVPGGVGLIAAGFIGNAGSLPSSWREHVTVAGIVAIGLAVHYIFTAFRESWIARAKSKAAAPASAEGEKP
jgi:MFS family permease